MDWEVESNYRLNFFYNKLYTKGRNIMPYAKKKKKVEETEFEYAVESVLGVISESTSSPWGKYVITARNGDKPSTTDVRNLRRGTTGDVQFETIGKGISLNGFEADKLTDIMLENGFGTTEVLEAELARRKSMYGLEEKDGESNV